MKTITFDSREQWMNARLGKITGSRLQDIVIKSGVTKDMIVKCLESNEVEFKKSASKEELQKLVSPLDYEKLENSLDEKLGFYELVAERLCVSEEDFDGYVPNETPMDRGTRLQKFAIDQFTKETSKKVDESLVLWSRDDYESIAISPDGSIIGEDSAIETKCLSSAKHLCAYLTNTIPDEYEFQKVQYFIVNDKLQKLYFAFYDPRIPVKSFFVIEFTREELQPEIDKYLLYQIRKLKKIDDIVAKLSNF